MMISTVQKTTCALAILVATTTAVMADSVDVKVIGTITPAACLPTLSGDGVIDYGNINVDKLPPDSQRTGLSYLDEKVIDLTITCGAPAKVMIAPTTGRGASSVGVQGELAEITTIHPLFGAANIGAYGLGMHGENGVGGYGLRVQPGSVLLDSQNADLLHTENNGSSFSKSSNGSIITSGNKRKLSWGAPGSVEPLAFTTMTGKLGVQAYINTRLDFSSQVKMDGLATLEVIYL